MKQMRLGKSIPGVAITDDAFSMLHRIEQITFDACPAPRELHNRNCTMKYSIRTLFLSAGLAAVLVVVLQAWWPRASSLHIKQSEQQLADGRHTATLYELKENSKLGAILLVVVERSSESTCEINYNYPIDIAGERLRCKAGKLLTVLIHGKQVIKHTHPIESATAFRYRGLFESGASAVTTAMEKDFLGGTMADPLLGYGSDSRSKSTKPED